MCVEGVGAERPPRVWLAVGGKRKHANVAPPTSPQLARRRAHLCTRAHTHTASLSPSSPHLAPLACPPCSVSVAWAGDSRAVLGVCDASHSMLGSVLASGESGAGLASLGSGSYDGGVHPLCAAVPLTEDHKPDRCVCVCVCVFREGGVGGGL